jgi:hypothetical protein
MDEKAQLISKSIIPKISKDIDTWLEKASLEKLRAYNDGIISLSQLVSDETEMKMPYPMPPTRDYPEEEPMNYEINDLLIHKGENDGIRDADLDIYGMIVESDEDDRVYYLSMFQGPEFKILDTEPIELSARKVNRDFNPMSLDDIMAFNRGIYNLLIHKANELEDVEYPEMIYEATQKILNSEIQKVSYLYKQDNSDMENLRQINYLIAGMYPDIYNYSNEKIRDGFISMITEDIKNGLDKIQIDTYADLQYTDTQASMLRDAILNGEDVKEIKKQGYTGNQMQILEEALKQGYDISLYKNASISEIKMKYLIELQKRQMLNQAIRDLVITKPDEVVQEMLSEYTDTENENEKE